MEQDSKVMAEVMEFSNNDWGLFFEESDGDGTDIILHNSFDTYEFDDGFIEHLKDVFNPESVIIECDTRSSMRGMEVNIRLERVPSKYFKGALEKVRKKSGEEDS